MVSPTFSADFSQRRFFGLFIAIMEMSFLAGYFSLKMDTRIELSEN